MNKIQILSLYFFCCFVMRVGMFITIPYLPIYLINSLHKSINITGVILGMAPLLSCTMGVFGGILADKLGSRFIMLVSIFCSSFIFLSFIITKSTFGLILLTGLEGLLLTFFESSSKSFLSTYCTSYNPKVLFSTRYSVINLGMSFGILLGALFINTKVSFIFLLTFLAYISCGLMLLLIKYNEYTHTTQNNKIEKNFSLMRLITALKNHKIILLILIGILLNLLFSQIYSTFPTLLSIKQIKNYLKIYSMLLVINTIGILIFQLLIFKIKKFNDSSLYVAGIICFSISFVGFAYFKELTFLIISMIVFTFGELISITFNTVLLDSFSDSSNKGTIFGISSISGLGQFLGPIIGSMLLTSLNSFAYVIFSILILICLPLYYKIKKS